MSNNEDKIKSILGNIARKKSTTSLFKSVKLDENLIEDIELLVKYGANIDELITESLTLFKVNKMAQEIRNIELNEKVDANEA